MTIGERVRVVRKELGLNQTEFGNRIGISTSAVSLFESSSSGMSDRTVRDICKVYGISQEWLLNGTGEMHDEKTETIDELALSFTELLNDYPGILSMAKLASRHMKVEDWQRLNEIVTEVVGE